MKKKKLMGVLLATAGVLLFSTKAIFVKLAYSHDINVISLLLLRMGFSLPIFILVSLYRNKQKNTYVLKTKDWFIIIILGVIGYYLASYFDFLGLQLIDASLERLILFAYPTFVVLFSRVFLKRKIITVQIVAIISSYAGMIVMFAPNLFGYNNESISYLGVFFILLSALTYALYLVGSNFMIEKIGATRFTNIAMIISCITVIFHYLSKAEIDIYTLNTEVYYYGVLMAIFSTVIPSYLISSAIEKIGAPNMAIIGSIGPVSTISLAIIFLNENLNLYQIAGGTVIVSSIIWMNLTKSTS